MSGTLQEAPVNAPAPPEPSRRCPPRHRRRALAALALLVIAGAAVALTDPFNGSAKVNSKAPDNGPPAALATVKRGTLSSQVNSAGTLGYVAQPDGSPYQVIDQAQGAFTQLPSSGQVIGCGQVLYRVDDNPVVLLCGPTPAYRSLSEGDSGPDVHELNANLVHLGYASSSELDPSSDYFSSETASALEDLLAKLGVDQTGSLDLGQAVFLPGPLRVSKTTAALGAPAHPGAPVAEATSTRRQVQVDLDASQQSSVKVGDRAQVTLPDNQTTPGSVSRIGTVASSSGSGQRGPGSGSNNATIPVYVTLKHPRAAGSLDQAPVQVQIRTAGVKDALIVPVNALLAQPGGYAVETVDDRGVRHLVPVTVGLFDDADGLVQVTSPSLFAGGRVVVPST
jgi:hypothetical protein